MLKSSTYLIDYFKSNKNLLAVQFAFLKPNESDIARVLIKDLNYHFKKDCLSLFFLNYSQISRFGSSFNYIVLSNGRLPLVFLFDHLLRLGLNFSIISTSSGLDGFFSLEFLKSSSFSNNLLLANFSNNLSRLFLLFIKKIKLFNSIKILKLLFLIKEQRLHK